MKTFHQFQEDFEKSSSSKSFKEKESLKYKDAGGSSTFGSYSKKKPHRPLYPDIKKLAKSGFKKARKALKSKK